MKLLEDREVTDKMFCDIFVVPMVSRTTIISCVFRVDVMTLVGD